MPSAFERPLRMKPAAVAASPPGIIPAIVVTTPRVEARTVIKPSVPAWASTGGATAATISSMVCPARDAPLLSACEYWLKNW